MNLVDVLSCTTKNTRLLFQSAGRQVPSKQRSSAIETDVCGGNMLSIPLFCALLHYCLHTIAERYLTTSSPPLHCCSAIFCFSLWHVLLTCHQILKTISRKVSYQGLPPPSELLHSAIPQTFLSAVQ